ncbi:unnamed protein product [Urochloa humidicola]
MAVSGTLPVVDLAPFLTGGDDGGIASTTEAVRLPDSWLLPRCQPRRARRALSCFLRSARRGEGQGPARLAERSKAPLPAGYGRQPAHSTDKNEYLVVFDPKLGVQRPR